MKVLKLEFTEFNQVLWKSVSYEITAQSIEQLKDAVFSELEWTDNSSKKEERWNHLQKFIQESYLEFPIIVTKNI